MKLKLKSSVTTTLSTVALTAITSVGLSSHAQAQTFVGDSSGTWGNPNPGTNTAAVFSGVGTNTFKWGDSTGFGTAPNQLTFTGNPLSTGIDSLFKVGDLTYFNGTTLRGTDVDSVPLNVALSFTSPSNLSENFDFTFQLNSTPNTGTPEQSADFVFPINTFGSSSFSLDGTDYTLQLTGFSQDGGATTVNQFRVLEGATTTAAVFGKITPAPVPESTSLAGVCLFGIYLAARRQTKAKKS